MCLPETEHLGLPDLRERKGLMDQPDRKASQALRDPKGQLELRAPLVQLGLSDLWDRPDPQDRLALPIVGNGRQASVTS